MTSWTGWRDRDYLTVWQAEHERGEFDGEVGWTVVWGESFYDGSTYRHEYDYVQLSPPTSVPKLNAPGRVTEIGSGEIATETPLLLPNQGAMFSVPDEVRRPPVGYWEGVGEVFQGYGDSVKGVLDGAWQTVRHPIQTAKGVATAVRHPILTGQAIFDDMYEKSGSLRGQGELAGDAIMTVFGAGGAKKGLDALKTGRKAVNLADDVAKHVDEVGNVVTKTPNSVQQLGDDIKGWLGEGYSVINKPDGDTVFMSRDGMRKYRTDFYNKRKDPPHVHFEEKLENGKWGDAIPDLPHKITVKP